MFPKETKFLVIDDLKTIRTMITEILHNLGYPTIEESEDGTKALALLKEAAQTNEPFGFIITDWNMPEMTGLELLEACKKDPDLKSIPFLMVTIESERSYVLRAVTMGVDDFIVKPFSERTFQDKLRSIWERRQERS